MPQKHKPRKDVEDAVVKHKPLKPAKPVWIKEEEEGPAEPLTVLPVPYQMTKQAKDANHH